MSKSKHTPGPWHWNVNPSSKLVRIIAANGDYVLMARRWGNSGTIWFQKPSSGIIENASRFLKDFPNRHHHRTWAQTIDHPDAHLIAAAPELFAFAERFLEIFGDEEDFEELCGEARDAIALASGERVNPTQSPSPKDALFPPHGQADEVSKEAFL